jgi:hypothetical protein
MKKSVMFFLVLLLFYAFLVPPANSFAQVIRKIVPIPRSEQAKITFVAPSAVCLQRGGAAAIATVEGKFLEMIQSAMAVKDGSEVGQIKVKLVPPWPGSNKVELQAATNAPVAKGYQLRLNGIVDFKKFRIDVPLSMFSLEVVEKKQLQLQKTMLVQKTMPFLKETVTPHEEGLGLPDLVITDDAWGQDSLKNFKFTAKLRNSGSKGVSFQTSQLMATIAVPGRSWEFKAPGGGIYIAPNSATDLSMTFAVDPTLISFTATWTANPEHVVTESDYSNNEKVTQVVIPLPDLVISELKVDQLPGFKEDMQILQFTIKVTNKGNGVAITKGGTNGTGCGAWLDGNIWNYEIFPSYIPNLDPGESALLKLRPKLPLVLHSMHIIKVVVDGGKTVNEVREDNNDATLSFTVQYPAEPPLLPDLVVSQITVNPTSGPPSTVFEFTITISNQGDAVGRSQLCEVRLDGAPGGLSVENSAYFDLQPGESMVMHRLRTNNPLAPGTHKLKATVDRFWYLEEKNEANNETTINFTVTM